MKMKIMIFLLSLGLNYSYGQAPKETVNVSIPEVYELANVILAITPYTLDANSFEVAKETKYYNEVLEHFMKYSNHPLIKKVNYSIEKWDYYLSFRTDAYAFDIGGNNAIKKRISFRAQDDRNEFESNLGLVEDFMKVSGFREFYKNHKGYYDSLISAYSKTQMINEMLSFLKEEFPSKKNKAVMSFSIIASPLVNRMNCHRDVNKIPTDFITLPNCILYGSSEKPLDYEIAQGIHMLFTETDHGFINPTTNDYSADVRKNFDFAKWDKNSGYTEFNIFNEYMTWAVYDIFIYKYFPKVADKVCIPWAKQNETRGFIASQRFNEKLRELYASKLEKETIQDLYPKILKWCSEVQINLNK